MGFQILPVEFEKKIGWELGFCLKYNWELGFDPLLYDPHVTSIYIKNIKIYN